MAARLPPRFDRLLRGSPLRRPRFRSFYLGSVASAMGYTAQATVAAWLMATLTPSALMVALVQTASTAPALIFGLPAGVLADILDRRRIMLVTHIVLVGAAALLGATALAGFLGPAALLLLTFVIGAAFTLYLPAQLATVNDLVSRDQLPAAVALNAVAYNVARAISPAMAGGIAAWLGSGSALLAAAVCFLGMIVATRRWRSNPPAMPGVPETLISGIASGLRYARHSPPLLALLQHGLSFGLCASALWALLPVVVRDQLGLGAGGFGMLSGVFGAGAVAAALVMGRYIKRVPLNRVVTGGVLVYAAALALIALSPFVWLAVVGACAAGAAWVCVFSSLSAATQSSSPAWVRARAVAMNIIGQQTSLAAGGVIWGGLASATTTGTALAAAAVTMLVLLAVNRRVPVSLGQEADVTPGAQLPDMTIAVEPKPEDGPILVQVEYRIDAERRGEFLRAVRAAEAVRRRNGAASWRVFRDLAEEGRFVERFIVTSWAEYVRLRGRMTMADRHLLDRVEALQRTGAPIRISRLIGLETSALEKLAEEGEEALPTSSAG